MKKFLTRRGSQFVSSIIAVAMLLLLMSAFAACDWSRNDNPEEQAEVYYSDFGAIGDGVVDDFDSIYAAHEYANEHNMKVKADKGAAYYIGAHTETVIVKTNTDWGNADFIMDDTKVSKQDKGYNVFEIRSDTSSYDLEIPKNYSLQAGQSNIGMTFETPVMIHLENKNKKDYIRYGANQNSGSTRQEIILVDANGNVDADTPILWDYTEVTKMTVYSVADEPIVVEGGTFTTISNKETVNAGYYARGINIKRSNTVLQNVKHYVTGEPTPQADPPADPEPGYSSAPYSGFYSVNSANNVTISDCLLTGHTAYRWQKPTGWVTQGTYDTTAANSNKVSWVNCKQSNDITDQTYWGVMSSNFCKNLVMQGCELSRFDAHQGVYNATIKDTKLGFTFNIIGAGTLLVENVERLSGSTFLTLRTDYGSTWQGDVIFKDCKMSAGNGFSIIGASWADWDFGYTCYLPETVTIENFQANEGAKGYVFSSITGTSLENVMNSKNPYQITKKVTVSNTQNELQISSNTSGLFAQTAFVK